MAAERDQPQACFTFASRLDRTRGQGYAAFVALAPPLPALSVVARDRSLCVEGLSHGTRYTVTLGQGLPGADGRRLAAAETHAIEVPNRAPALAFRGGGLILPRVGAEGLPLRAINIEHVRLRVLRMADRALVEKIYAGRVAQTLSDWDIGELVEKGGKGVWTGELSITAARNAPAIVTFPLAPLLDGLEAGVYLATAEAVATGAAGPAPEGPRASQWFVIADLGLTTFFGDDGLTVFARAVTRAQPLAGVELHLLARNGKELAKRRTGADGIVRFEAEVTRRSGDEAVQALFAYGGSDEFSFLDLAAPGVDLGDRSAVGRNSPGPLDAFLATGRSIYRPGETVSVTTLLRDNAARAVPGRTWTLKLWRPDGVEADLRAVRDAGAGGGSAAFPLMPTTLPGLWSITAHSEPDGPAIGRTEFTVHDLLPPRLDFVLSAGQPALTPGHGGSLGIESRTLFGTPAAHLPGELSMTIRTAETPFPAYAGFRFGLAQETFTPIQTVLPGFTTNGAGLAEAEVPTLALPDSSHPLQAVIRGTIFDIGGRAVSRELVLPIHDQPFRIGIRPRFEDDAVPEGATAAFEVIAVGPDGATLARPDLSYELYEEDSEFRWFEAGGRWDYETVIRDHRLTGGTVAVGADRPATLEEPLHAGRYRLEVFDPGRGIASSVRFTAGWWSTPAAGNRPDAVEVSVLQRRGQEGGPARVHIRPPYDSQVVIAVADRSVRQIISRQIGAEGAFLDLPVSPDWSAGMTIIATAYAAVDPLRKTAPRRAIGIGWLAVDAQPRTLRLAIDVPPVVEPRRTLTLPVAVRSAAGALLPADSPAFLTVAAVDEAVLQVTGQPTPDPVAYYLGQRRLGVELRDVYGRLLDPVRPGPAASRGPPVEKRRLSQVSGLPERDAPVVTLFSGVVRVGADGVAAVPLAIPDFDGRLRLIALAWDGTRVGHAEATLAVHDRVRTELALPRFLAPGDRAVIEIGLTNLAAAPGDYQVMLTTEGGVSVADGRFAVGIKRGRRVTVSRTLSADRPGPATLRVEISGPEGYHLIRSRAIKVRPAVGLVWRHQAATLEAGQPLTVPPGLFEGLRPDSVSGAVTLGHRPTLDLAGLVMAVERQPRGSVAQVATDALRLIAGGDLAVTLGLDTAESLRQRIQAALDRVLGQQHGDGGFSAWSLKEDSDDALTPLVADVLDRAVAAGFRVPESATRRAHDWLKRLLDSGWGEDRELPARAGAVFVLARAGSLDAGAVHYFHETFGPRLASPAARALVAAALARVGDDGAARALFNQIADALTGDAGTRLAVRDLAVTLALGAESGALGHERQLGLAERLTARTAGSELRLAADERAWLTLAARAVAALTVGTEPQRISAGEIEVETPPPLYRRLDPAAPPPIRNPGPDVLTQLISVVGLPADPPPAAEHGFTLSRSLFDLEGQPLKPEAVRQNDLVVVILEGKATTPGQQRIVLGDLLPAGLDVETVRFADSPQLGDLSWLGGLSLARHADYRHDRFIAVLDLEDGHPGFRVVYLARAVTQGDFIQPGATVEAAGDPDRFARTASGRLQIHGRRD